MGYTAGARNHPLFDWTKNLKSKKHDPDDLKDINFEISSVFALFWALLRVHLPQEVLRGFEDYLADNDMCRMDADEKRGNVEGEYMVQWGDQRVEFGGVELAPPAGVAGCNYARYV